MREKRLEPRSRRAREGEIIVRLLVEKNVTEVGSKIG